MKANPAFFYRAPDAAEAHSLKSLLEREGIGAHVVGGNMQLLFGELGAEALMAEVWVDDETDLARAREVVERDQARRNEARPVSREGIWACEKCGESNPPEFTLCWNCGTESE